VRALVQRAQFVLGRHALTGKLDARPQRDARDRELSNGVLLHRRERAIGITFDYEPALRREREEPEHMTTGSRCN
jgi:hypothetical protein